MRKIDISQLGKLMADDLRRAQAAMRPAVAAGAKVAKIQVDAALASIRPAGRGQPLQTEVRGDSVALVEAPSTSIPAELHRLIPEVAAGLDDMDNVYHLVFGAAKRLGIDSQVVRPHIYQIVAAAKYANAASDRALAAVTSSSYGEKVAAVFVKEVFSKV